MADQILFTPGDKVELISGPFAKLGGSVKEVDQIRQRLLVILEMGSWRMAMRKKSRNY